MINSSYNSFSISDITVMLNQINNLMSIIVSVQDLRNHNKFVHIETVIIN